MVFFLEIGAGWRAKSRSQRAWASAEKCSSQEGAVGLGQAVAGVMVAISWVKQETDFSCWLST
jgi:hypothetical protein